MKAKITILVTNNIRQDQRMKKISLVLAEMGFGVELVGRQIQASDKVQLESRKTKLLKLPFKKGVPFYLSYAIYSFFYLIRTRPDVVYAVDCDTLFPATMYKILFQKKLIYDAHELFDQVPELEGNPTKKMIWRKIEKWGTRHSILNISVAPTIGEILNKRNQVSFEIIRNLSRFEGHVQPHNNWNRRILLYQGMLNEGRGLEFIISLMDELEDWHLWIVGSGDLENRLKAQAANSLSKDRIVFHGFVDPEQLPELTKQATWGFNLLDSNSESYYLSLANRTFDYMAAGVPAIHMNFPEYRYLQEQFSCFELIDNLDKETVLNIIRQSSEERYLELQSKNQKAIQQLNWDQESLRLRNIVSNVLPTER